MVDAVDPRRGERVLELAAGLGETGMLAAELIAPLGGVVISDQAEAMLEGARARAAELELSNIEFQTLNAEWIDLAAGKRRRRALPLGLHADGRSGCGADRDSPRAASLRPPGARGVGRDRAQPLGATPSAELIERGLLQTPPRRHAGPLRARRSGARAGAAGGRGFTDIELEAIGVVQRHEAFESFWEMTLDVSRNFHDVVLGQPEAQIAEIRAGLAERLAPFTAGDGALEIPGRSLVASAIA